MKYNYRVSDITHSTADTVVVTLQPNNPQSIIRHTAGQYATFSFMIDGRPTPARCFSIVSRPGSEQLQFAMRIRGAFTSTVRHAPVGTAVAVQGPFGDFVLHPDTAPIILLAGGIGITPYISMLRQAAATQLTKPIYVLHANRDADNIPFYDEIMDIQRQNSYIKAAFFVDKPSISGRSVIKSPITAETLQQVTAGDYTNKYFYICGPKGFSQAMAGHLRANHVPHSAILSESFSQGVTAGFGGIALPRLTYTLAGAAMVALFAIIASTDITSYLGRVKKASAATVTPVTSQTTTLPTATPTTVEPSDEDSTQGTTPTELPTPTVTTPTPTTTPSSSPTTVTPTPVETQPTPVPTPTYRPPRSQVS